MTNNEYRIEKIRRRVIVTLAGGRTIEGDVFVQPSAPYRAGPQDPADLFNEPEPFVPVATATDELILVAKEQIVVVKFAADATDTLVGGVGDASIEVAFADGSIASGNLRLETRADRPRLLDFLNDVQHRFLTLRSPQGVCLINCRMIAQVRQRR